MRIGLAQINTTVGDFEGNKRLILDAYRNLVADGAELVLTPELAVTGYPPRDLVFRSGFVRRSEEVIQELARETGEVPLIAGFVEHNTKERGKPFRNAAAVLRGGGVVAVRHKSLLPTYDVFDEARYFEPADEVSPVVVSGLRLGITVCEDIWTDEYLPRPLYHVSPPDILAGQGIDLLINLSASPFHAGKPGVREAMMCAVARELRVPIAYCNAVGGNDQLVFDGHSVVINQDGSVSTRLPGFVERVAHDNLRETTSETEQIYQALVLGTRDYIRKCGFKSAVIGLSGGIDSALTAVIAAEALGPENVTGVSMPSRYSSEGSKDDARDLARNLGIHCHTVPIEPVFAVLKDQLSGVFAGRPEDLTEENMQSRIRGVIMMSISNKFGHLLLTTGNKSELAVGYCTIYGDMCGGLAVISDLPKMRVYEVARWINREKEIIPWPSIEKPPSAELKPDQKDQDTLPPYDVLDAILELLVEQHLSVREVAERGFAEETVRWIARKIDLNEWKRHQAAPGLRVTTKAFGVGRRIPIVQRFTP
ncbi:MAG: NAD+ synthase [Verrucomicrobiaceae bacterium]|nr:NAD+ synthase [Verrucomicrobiaceae bacterium]